MLNIFVLLFCIILALITYYDFKFKALPLYILVIAVVFGVFFSIIKNGLHFTLLYAVANAMLICVQLVVTSLYFSIKNRKFTNIFNTYLGIGDGIFFLVIIFIFSPVNFILFIVLSAFLTLIFYARSKNKVQIPFAGCLSMLLCLVLFFSTVFEIIQPYNDYFLIDKYLN